MSKWKIFVVVTDGIVSDGMIINTNKVMVDKLPAALLGITDHRTTTELPLSPRDLIDAMAYACQGKPYPDTVKLKKHPLDTQWARLKKYDKPKHCKTSPRPYDGSSTEWKSMTKNASEIEKKRH